MTKLLFAIIISISGIIVQAQELIKYVDPFIGTGGHGHTFPGATLPFGMVQLSPDTDIEGWDWCSGYNASDGSIMGFSHTHLSGTGSADYGDILIMPTIGRLLFSPGSKENPKEGYRSRFSHKNEIASPGYYKVFLDDYNIRAEFTVSKRVGLHRYTFPKSDSANIIIDLKHGIHDRVVESYINFVGNNRIEGYRRSTGWAPDQRIYFVMKFSKPFKTFGTVNNDMTKKNNRNAKGTDVKGYATFNTQKNEQIMIKVALSGVSIEGAIANMKKEIPDWNFDNIHSKARKIWEKELSKIIVEGGTKEQKTIFYTSLYHCMIHPNIFTDVDDSYLGMDKKIYKADSTGYYTVYSLWDTFRALHPLFTIIEPEKDGDFVNSLVKKYEESGILPKWELASNETGSMIGYHAVSAIADAYMKGIRNFDINKAFEAMKSTADMDHLGLESYKKLGYVTSGLGGKGSLSKTIEFAYDDWCIAIVANALGKKNDYKHFSKRAENYKNVFNSSNGFMQARLGNGNWVPFFNPYEVTKDYTEANAWQYSFYVPHDVKGLIDLYGNKDVLNSMLDRLFSDTTRLTGNEQPDISGMIGQYAHGNEPSHHMAYLYDYTGEPWKTQKLVSKILNEMYSTNRDGIAGNEDCGQMSAWYVLSSMGFYPFCPGTNEYLIGSPIFDKVTIDKGYGKKFTIIAKNASKTNPYVQSVTLNGKPYAKNYFLHSDIINGSKFVFEMGKKPNKKGGTNISESPYSFTEKDFVSPPYQKTNIALFKDSAIVNLQCRIPEAKIYYTLDNSYPDQKSALFKKPFTITKTTNIKARSYLAGFEPSNVISFTPEKLRYLESENPGNIVNGIKYTYYEGDFTSVLDLEKSKPIKSGTIGYFNFNPAKIDDHFGFKYQCYVKIPKDGIYKFYLRSDDGSIIYVGNKIVVSNDGRHAPMESSGAIALKSGFHFLTILFFEDKNGQELKIFYEGPDIQKQIIPEDILFVQNN